MKLIFVIFSLSIFHLSGCIINPIIIIPGNGGSQLEVKMDENADVSRACKKNTEDYFTLWINTMYCLTHPPSCIFEVLQQNYNKRTRLTSNRAGIHTRVPGFGSTDKLEYLDTTAFMSSYFKTIISRLVREGYTPGESLKAAPYDFRKGPHEQMDYLRRLEEMIVEMYENNGRQKIIIIAHSLGGLMTMMFLKRQPKTWKDQYIKCLISVSVGWGGSVKAIEAYMKGFSIRLAETTPKCARFSTVPLLQRPQNYVRLPKLTIVPSSVLRTMPAIIWLFPSVKAWKKTDVLVRSRTPDEKLYTLNDMKEFFTDLGDENGWEMYDDVESFQKEVSDPGVELHCLYGTDIDTIALVDHSTSAWDFLKFPITDDGDGLVNLQSLQVCEEWSKKSTRVKPRSFLGVTHRGMLNNSDVLDHIVDIINNKLT